MKTVNLKLTGRANFGDPLVYVDGKQATFKKNKFGNLVHEFETDKATAKVEVYRALDVGGFFWFITQLFFFLISIFGIFDIHRKEKFIVVRYNSVIELKDKNDITIKLNTLKENGKPVEIEGDASVVEIENSCEVDTKAKKKVKWLRLTKALLAVGIIVGAILWFVFGYIGM